MITAIITFSVALAVAQATQVPQATPAPPAPPMTRPPVTPEGVDGFVLAEMARQHIPGVSLAVVKAGEIVKAKGYGLANVERNEPVTPATVFRIGSMSKQFIATGIMLLAQDGKLTVDDPISKYFASAPASWRPITLRHLLTHTSGVVREGPLWRKGKPDSVVVQSAFPEPLRFPTGSKFGYCNVCYFALADVIARASGTSWDAFITQRVFASQGMTSTRTAKTDVDLGPRGATGYFWNEASRFHKARYTVADPEPAVRPSGAFQSTVLDLAKWDAQLYRDDLLTRASRNAMWTPVRLTDTTTSWYGFGWFVDSIAGHRFVGHGGSTNGFQSTMFRFLDDSLTVIVLTNGDPSEPDDIAIPIARAYLLEKDEAPLRAGLARDNDSLDVHRRLARLYLSHQSYVKALDVLEAIVRRRPTDRFALIQLGFLGAEMGIAPSRGERALTAFLALPPISGRGPGSNYPLAHYWMGLIYEQRGEFDKARAEVAAALQLNPDLKGGREAEQRLRERRPGVRGESDGRDKD